jgi:hypothetical protein
MYNLLDAVRRTLAAGYQSTHSNIPEGLWAHFVTINEAI